MTEKDFYYVISILKGEEPIEAPDWFSVLGFLSCNRIEGLFYNRAQKNNVNLPKKIEKILETAFEKQKRKVVFMRNELKAITEGLEEDCVQYMLLKGSVLSNLSKEDAVIYEDGERISNDIDLLVKPDEIASVVKSLYKLGFVQGVYDQEEDKVKEFFRLEIVKRRMNRGEIAPFVKKTGNIEFPFIEIDINFSLGNTPSEGAVLINEMITSSKNYFGEVKMKVSSEELFFTHLIMHQYKELCLLFMVERNKDLDLYKLADIYYILKANVLNLESLHEIIEKYKLQQEFGVVLQQIGELFFDEEILDYSKRFISEIPMVVDFDTKKMYEWKATYLERMCSFDSKGFLFEVRYDK